MLEHTKKLKINTSISLLNRLVGLVAGMILPRLILSNYGSEVNGLVSSITQFLSIITFLDLGVGAVVQSALYKPLAQKDNLHTSIVLTAAKRYFKKIAYALIVYVIMLMVFYPLIINSSLEYISTLLLIFSLSISLFAQYYFGIINEILLNADQKSYIQLGTEIITILMNLVASVVLIKIGASIQFVKLSTSLIFLLRPIYLNYYVRKTYDLDYIVTIDEDPLPQKWSGMGQHVAYSIQKSVDVVSLTLFTTLSDISIYNIHNLVVGGLYIIITSLTTSFKSFFGTLIARDEKNLLNDYFGKFEWGLHQLVIFLFGVTAVLIDSFVMLYTKSVTDVNYFVPVFSLMLVISGLVNSLKIPYQSMILAAGHFRQTQASSIIEAIINVIASFSLVPKLGLVGAPIATLIAVSYRMVYLVWYLSKEILNRSSKLFAKLVIVDFLSFILILILGRLLLLTFVIESIPQWILLACIFSVLCLILMTIINSIFYKTYVIYLYKKIFRQRGF